MWVLVWIVTSQAGYPGNPGIATGSAVFHSNAACEAAAKSFKLAFCFEDAPPKPVPTVKKVDD